MVAVKGLFGLGITSPTGAYTRLSRSKATVAIVTAATMSWPAKVDIVIVSGLHVLSRFTHKIREKQVVVISDISSLLTTIPNLEPLDYTNKVSFIFNYVEPDYSKVLKAVRSKGSGVNLVYNKVDQLGFIINNLKKTDDTLNAWISLLSNLPFNSRGRLFNSLYEFFHDKKVRVETLIDCVEKEASDSSLQAEKNRFIASFCDKAEQYYEAFNSGFDAKNAAEKYGVDAYALSFFKKKLNALEAPKKRLANQPGRAKNHARKDAA